MSLLTVLALASSPALASPQEPLPAPVAPAPPARPQAAPATPQAAPAAPAAVDAVPPTPLDGAALPDPHAALHHFAHDGVHWVRGRTYKAAADADGFTYTPFLGAEAPRSWPLKFSLVGATSGGEAIPFESNGRVVAGEERIVIDRGPIDVAYDLALDGVEQSFTVEAGVLGAGLELELALDTDLVGRALPSGGFRFDGPDGGVEYGTAIAFDAAGHRTDVPVNLEGATLRLTVPPAFMASAEGPVTVDPVVTSFTVNANPAISYLEPDVTYDRTNNVFLYVYEDVFSASDVDLFYTVTDSSGGFVDDGFVYISGPNNSDPEAANLDLTDQCLVVWSAENTSGGSDILGRLYDVNAGTWGGVLDISSSTTASLDQTRPDVGGGALSTNPSRFLVGWSAEQADGDVDANFRHVRPDESLGTRFRMELTTNKIKDEVVIGASLGTDAASAFWPVVVREEDRTTGDVVLKGIRWRPDGNTVLESAFTLLALPSGVDATDVDVSSALSLAGLAPTYLVAFDRDGASDQDITLLVCRESTRENTIDLTALEHGPVERNQLMPRLSTTREDFVVTYLEQRPGTLITDPYLSVVDLIEEDFLGVSEQRTRLGDGGALFSGGAAPASRFDGGLTNSRVNGIAWARFDAAASSWNVYGVRHSAFNPAIAGPQYCVGTPNSTGERGFLMVQGDNSTTATKTLRALRLPPGQFGLFASATLPAFVPVVQNSSGALCIGGAIGRFSSQIAQIDANGELEIVIDPTALPTPNGTEAAVAGSFRQFQLWHRDVEGGVTTSNFTNGVSVFFR